MLDINLKNVVSEPIELSVGPPYDPSKPSTHRGPTPHPKNIYIVNWTPTFAPTEWTGPFDQGSFF